MNDTTLDDEEDGVTLLLPVLTLLRGEICNSSIMSATALLLSLSWMAVLVFDALNALEDPLNPFIAKPMENINRNQPTDTATSIPMRLR